MQPVFTFIESSVFERICPIYLDDDEYAELQQHMMLNPEGAKWSVDRVAFGSFGGSGQAWASAAAFALSTSSGSSPTSFGC